MQNMMQQGAPGGMEGMQPMQPMQPMSAPEPQALNTSPSAQVNQDFSNPMGDNTKMSQQQEVTISKLAYVNGMAETLGEMKLAAWHTQEAYNNTVEKVAAALNVDPAEQQFTTKMASEVIDAVISVARQENSKRASVENMQRHVDSLQDPGTKTATLDYYSVYLSAQRGASKLASALSGLNPNIDEIGNSLADSAQYDDLAQLELERRPLGYAEQAPDDRAVGGALGTQSVHPKADELGKNNDAEGAGFQPAGQKEARALLNNLFGQKRASGYNPNEGGPGNSLTDSEAHDSLSALELARRPKGYAENAPDDRSVGGHIGSQNTHHKADELGRNNDGEGYGFQPAGKSAAMNDPEIASLPPTLQRQAWENKQAAASKEMKKVLFEKALKIASQNPKFNTLSDAAKLQFCKQAMYLNDNVKVAFFNAI